jgi:hypothetical protein
MAQCASSAATTRKCRGFEMSSAFKLGFVVTFVIGLLAVAAAIYLGMQAEPTAETVKNIAALWQVATGATGVIFGLVGGRAS